MFDFSVVEGDNGAVFSNTCLSFASFAVSFFVSLFSSYRLYVSSHISVGGFTSCFSCFLWKIPFNVGLIVGSKVGAVNPISLRDEGMGVGSLVGDLPTVSVVGDGDCSFVGSNSPAEKPGSSAFTIRSHDKMRNQMQMYIRTGISGKPLQPILKSIYVRKAAKVEIIQVL